MMHSCVEVVTVAASLLFLSYSFLMVVNTCLFGPNSVRRNPSKSCISIIKRWFRRKKTSYSSKDNPQTQKEPVQDDTTTRIRCFRLNSFASKRNDDDDPMSPRGSCSNRRRSLDSSCFPSLSRNASRKINRAPSKNSDFVPSSLNSSCSLGVPPHLRNIGRRNSTPIMYSNSSGMLKPPPIETKLECTLEQLCYGCKKNIMITRDVVTDTGGIVEEEELLTIDVIPGWKQGTKITFEGKGNERPRAHQGDILFFITEKIHPLFIREGDDLELGIEIPLVKALTGCKIVVPLLGGEQMSLTVDNIIQPGYVKIIPGQGMPISNKPGKRGNLKITFLVEFPTQLTSDQRSEVFHLLQDSC